MNIIKLSKICNRQTVLTGLLGKQIYPRLVEFVGHQNVAQPLFIDFKGVTASGSFFGQAILPLRDYSLRFNLYPVLCNIDEETTQELQWLLDISPDAFLICDHDEFGNISNKRWVGVLEEKQKLTFEAVLKEKATDANSLSRKYSSEKIGVTGWNNRLSSLAAKGLIVEFKNGRGKSYRPVLEVHN